MRMLVKIAASLAVAVFAMAQIPQKPPTNAVPFFKGDKKSKEDPNGRIVEGAVKNDAGNAVEGAVVKLKDTKTLQIRSFITKADGHYRFGGLRKDIEYELKADFQGGSSSAKTLSVFDSRKEAIINLKIEPKS